MANMMDADYSPAVHDQHQYQQQHGAATTQLTKQLGVQHLCDHRCAVHPLFGNAFRCESSGQVHICDANCSQRVYRDRFSSVCRISKRVFANPVVAPLPSRKRGGCTDIAAGGGGADAVGCKRFMCRTASQEDMMMVM